MKWAVKALVKVESSVLIMLTKTEQISLNDYSLIKYLLYTIYFITVVWEAEVVLHTMVFFSFFLAFEIKVIQATELVAKF